MSKLAFLQQFQHLRQFESDTKLVALYNAFLFCLSPEEACAALDLTFNQSPRERKSILRKISDDMSLEFRDCHLELLIKLMSGYALQPGNKRQTVGYCIDTLYDVAPQELKREIVRFFLSSKHVGMRRRGYNKLYAGWDSEYQVTVEDTWKTYRDPECASVIINLFPPEYLDKNYSDLEDTAFDYARRRLYINLSPLSDDRLQKIAEEDEITYLYVLAKQNTPIGEAEAIDIYERNKHDPRLGLLIWCLGRMKLWGAVEYIYDAQGYSRLDATANGSNN
jgi:hypothetical protein